MNQEEKILEFDEIKEKWMEFAVTEKARQEIRESVPILSESMLMSRLRETTEARQLLETCGNPPLVSMDGIEALLRTVSRGECLSAGQLEQVKLALVAVKRLISYLNTTGINQSESLVKPAAVTIYSVSCNTRSIFYN